jgi:hypothetical protein
VSCFIAHVEITWVLRLGELSEIIERMREHLQQAIPDSDVVIVPKIAGGKIIDPLNNERDTALVRDSREFLRISLPSRTRRLSHHWGNLSAVHFDLCLASSSITQALR